MRKELKEIQEKYGEDIFRLASELITNPEIYGKMARAVNPYGDGRACRRIVDAILYHFGRIDSQPEAFLG